MPIMKGAAEPDNILVGSEQVDKIYLGDELVWGGEALPIVWYKLTFINGAGTTKTKGIAEFELHLKDNGFGLSQIDPSSIVRGIGTDALYGCKAIGTKLTDGQFTANNLAVNGCYVYEGAEGIAKFLRVSGNYASEADAVTLKIEYSADNGATWRSSGVIKSGRQGGVGKFSDSNYIPITFS